MGSNNELKEINIKNCTCYYFNHIIEDFDFDNILLHEKPQEKLAFHTKL